MSATNLVLELDGIFGEPPEKQPARIEFDSFVFGLTNPGTAGQPTGRGKHTILDFGKKPNDKSSSFVTYELENVLITTFQPGGSNGSSTQPMEQVSFSYATIAFVDAEGGREVFVQTENSSIIETENDETHWVGHDRVTGQKETVTISIDRTETVDHNETITIHVKRTEPADLDHSILLGDRQDTGGLAPHAYCVQYRESDFDFAARLLEEEGIFYFLSNSGGDVSIACAKGEHIADAVLNCRVNPFLDPNPMTAYPLGSFSGNEELSRLFAIELEQVYVTSYQVGSSNSLPMESLSLNYTLLQIPRIGQEVIVDFLEGDPDQPTISAVEISLDGNFQVNIVDFIDEDEISTPFMFPSFSAGGAAGQPVGLWIFGTELPSVVLNEAMTETNKPCGVTHVVLPGFSIAVGDLNRDGVPDIVVARIGKLEFFDYPGEYSQQMVNEPPAVSAGNDATILEGQSFHQTGLTPYETKFLGGVRVATGDVNSDGIPDIITAPGPRPAASHQSIQRHHR